MRLPVAFVLAIVIVAGGATGCQKTDPGLALHVTLPAQAFAVVEEVQVSLVPIAGSLGGTVADTSENGVGIHSEPGRVVLTFTKGSFPLAAEFDVLVVPTGAALVTATVTAQMLEADGRLLGSAAAVQARLDPGGRTTASLTLTCSNADCSPLAGSVLDLATPDPAIRLLTVTGAADSARLVPVAVGKFRQNCCDLVAAAPAAGLVYVFYAPNWSLVTTLDTSSANVTISNSARPGESLGDAVAVGDFDGDGVDDLVVTSRNATAPGNLTGAGAAYLILGGRLATAGPIDLGTSAPDMKVYGGARQDSLGTAVALAHVTSTQNVDLVVGAPGAASAAGRVYVVFGGATPPAQVVTGDPGTGEQDATILAPSSSAQLGLAVAAGDLNGNDLAEIILGTYLDAGGGRGSVHVVKDERVTLDAVVDLAQAAQVDTRVVGPPNSWFGWSVAVADVDGDGTRNLVVGTGQSPNVYVLSPALDGAALDITQNQFDLVITGPAGAAFGVALASGDLDGDTAADLVIGAPKSGGPDGARTEAGAAFVLLGSDIGPLTAGQARALTLSATPGPLTVYGAAKGDHLGSSVLLGNIDIGDPLDEIIVGAPDAAGGGTKRGVIYAIQNLPSQ